jgi:hypothetical protein
MCIPLYGSGKTEGPGLSTEAFAQKFTDEA